MGLADRWLTFRVLLASVGILSLFPQAAEAATLSGFVLAENDNGLSGMEVRLWAEGPNKRWDIVAADITDGNGFFQFDVGAGLYKVDAHMGPGVVGNYADRWYDVADPIADGWIGEDADVLDVADATVIDTLEIVLPVMGGLNGYVSLDGGPRGGLWVRVERASEPRYHHNDFTKDPCCHATRSGFFYMQGLVPGDDYRVLIYDSDGVLETFAVAGPFSVVSNSDASLGEFPMVRFPIDPYEPNGNPDADNAGSVDGAGLHADVSVPWDSSGAYIGPRGGDLDWYCWDAVQGDRYLVSTATGFLVGGDFREDPWVDPILSIWHSDGTALWVDDDDSAGDTFNASLDTGEVLTDTRLCALVSTFGDTTWSGVGQQSAGRYNLHIEMGNRRPTLTAFVGDVETPAPPDAITVEALQPLLIDVDFDDPDNDILTLTADHENAFGTALDEADLDIDSNTAVFSWTPAEQAYEGSPYVVTFALTDGELGAERTVVIDVTAINTPPTAPTLLLPLNGAIVEELPALTVANGTDANGDPLQIDFELYAGSDFEEPFDALRLDADDSGETAWTLDEALPEDVVMSWRARCFDGYEDDGYSAWTTFHTFRVNLDNQPPATPVLTKPTDGEDLLVTSPALSADNVVDPDGNSVSLVFEVALEEDFVTVVAESPQIPQSETGSSTSWTASPELERGVTYYARVFAIDNEALASPSSNVNQFRVLDDDEPEPDPTPPPQPEIGECLDRTFSLDEPMVFRVASVVDPDGAQLSMEIQVFLYDEDPETSTPVESQVVPQGETETVFELNSALYQADVHYRFRLRTDDGELQSDWVACGFWVSDTPVPVGALTILSPTPGQSFPLATTEVTVTVSNASPPEGFVGFSLLVAYCAARDAELSTCPPDPADWSSVLQTSLSPADTTDFMVDGLTPGEHVWVQACALDLARSCGPADTTDFVISTDQVVLTPGCSCDAAREGQDVAGAAATLVCAAALWAGGRRSRRTRRA